MTDIIYLKELDFADNNGDLIIFNEKVDKNEFKKAIDTFWELQIEKGNYEFDEMYDFIKNNFNVKEIIFLDNLDKVYY